MSYPSKSGEPLQCSPKDFFKEYWGEGQALGQGGGRNVRDY